MSDTAIHPRPQHGLKEQGELKPIDETKTLPADSSLPCEVVRSSSEQRHRMHCSFCCRHSIQRENSIHGMTRFILWMRMRNNSGFDSRASIWTRIPKPLLVLGHVVSSVRIMTDRLRHNACCTGATRPVYTHPQPRNNSHTPRKHNVL
jgi:hypothetical protein